jgi:HNH endonuclease
MEEYKEIELYGTKLRVYPNGDIWKFGNWGVKNCKKNEWRLLTPTPNKDGYISTEINNKNVKCHRIIGYAYLGLDITDKKKEIDHINRIRNDNSVDNLQIVTHQQNCFNKHAKGCFYIKSRNKYRAQISVDGKKRHLGYYDTEEEASARYYEEKAILHII